MKNKGFTLIELLAVIVILAIIALIATPIILGIIEDARKEAKNRTAELVANGIELAYTSYLFDNSGVGSPDNFCAYMTTEYFTMDSAELVLTEGVTGCTASNLEVSILGDDNVTYTAKYNGGSVTVTYPEQAEPVTVKLKN